MTMDVLHLIAGRRAEGGGDESEPAGTIPRVPSGAAGRSGYGPPEQGRAARDLRARAVAVSLGAPA